MVVGDGGEMGKIVGAHRCEDHRGALQGDGVGGLVEADVCLGAAVADEGVGQVGAQGTNDGGGHDGGSEGQHAFPLPEGVAPRLLHGMDGESVGEISGGSP